MVDNATLINEIASIINDMNYRQTYNDIEADETLVMGIYTREAGNPIGTMSDPNKIQRIDLTIRLHGDTSYGSIQKCEKDLIKITQKLTMCNKEFNGFKILGSSLRGRGIMIGRTSKKIPVFNISFLITFN